MKLKRLSVFTGDLCRTLDNMISGNEEPGQSSDSETLFARISHRLSRLYSIMQENRRKVDEAQGIGCTARWPADGSRFR